MASVIPPAFLGTDGAAEGFDSTPATRTSADAAAERLFRFELAAHPSFVADARRMTRARLSSWGLCEDTCEKAALVVSELVTNAIVHSTGRRIVCELHDGDDLLRISVRDEGCVSGEPHPSPQRPEEEHGRGLLLIEAMCRAWGTQEAGSGLLVWADLPRTLRAPRSGDTSRPTVSTRPVTPSTRPLNVVPRMADGHLQDRAARSELDRSVNKPPVEDRGNGAEDTGTPPHERSRERGRV